MKKKSARNSDEITSGVLPCFLTTSSMTALSRSGWTSFGGEVAFRDAVEHPNVARGQLERSSLSSVPVRVVVAEHAARATVAGSHTRSGATRRAPCTGAARTMLVWRATHLMLGAPVPGDSIVVGVVSGRKATACSAGRDVGQCLVTPWMNSEHKEER